MTVAAEHETIRELARDFAEGELRPHGEAWDAARALHEGVFTKLAEVGFLGMRIGEAYGGLGFDLHTYHRVLEEIAWGDASVALSVAIHNGPVAQLLLDRGTPEQKERWLPAMASGQALGAFALSEPEAGSDATALATRARRDEGGWRLEGVKRWVTNGARAGLVVVFAATDDEGGIGAFLVDPSAEGYRVLEEEKTMGLRASQTVTVALEGVHLPDDALLGDPADGWRAAKEALDLGRLGIAAQAVGIARAAWEHATRYALEREQFGRPIARFGAVQVKIAEMARRVTGARALLDEAARAWEARAAGGDRVGGAAGATAMAAMAKLTASEAATWVADEAVQVFGGYGYMRDYPVERLLRDAKGTEIYEGTNEIMRFIIAREALRAAEQG